MYLLCLLPALAMLCVLAQALMEWELETCRMIDRRLLRLSNYAKTRFIKYVRRCMGFSMNKTKNVAINWSST